MISLLQDFASSAARGESAVPPRSAVASLASAGAMAVVDAVFVEAVDGLARDFVAPAFWSRLDGFKALMEHNAAAEALTASAARGGGGHSAVRQRRAARQSADMMRYWACEHAPTLVGDTRRAFVAFDTAVAAALGEAARGSALRAELRDRFSAGILGRAGGHTVVLRAMAAYFERMLLCFERRGDAECDDDAAALAQFERVCGWLHELGWSEFLAGTVTEVVFERIEAHVCAACRGLFEEPMLDSELAWLRRAPAVWHAAVLSEAHDAHAATQWGARLEYRLHECFFSLRCAELFDVIRDFPESRPALIDVAACLRRTQGGTQQHPLLVASLGAQLRARLLHPGAETAQVVDVYISTIRALGVVDPTGVLLQAVADPVKEYLRQRTDTVRSIVTSLTDDTGEVRAVVWFAARLRARVHLRAGPTSPWQRRLTPPSPPPHHQDGAPSELFEELGKDRGAVVLGAAYIDDDAASVTTVQWSPDANEADPTRAAHTRRSDDIIRMLVDIYGSTELFVTEYQQLLARKLVEKFGFDTEREMHTLELLKRRFGDGLLRPCEVMLKDLEDSRRINQGVAKDRARGASSGGEEGVAPVLEGVILSRHFWPKASTSHPLDAEALQHSAGGAEDGVSSLRLHPNVESALDAFSLEYKRMKQPRSLLWQKCLGSVQLELAIGEEGETREFTVSPLHASLIMFFSEREVWTLTELAEAVGMPPQMRAQLKRHMHRWVTLVRRVPGRVAPALACARATLTLRSLRARRFAVCGSAR